MPPKKFSIIRRVTLPAAISIILHGGVIAGLLYVTMTQSAKTPKQEMQVMSVSMVSPAELAPPPAPAIQPLQVEPQPVVDEVQPEVKPEPEPPPKAIVLPEPKPKPKPKPKPEPVKKPVEKPKPKIKPTPKPVEKTQEKSESTTPAPASENKPTAKPANAKPVSQAAAGVNTGPRPLVRGKPQYPARAYALRIEGRVKVQFDVDSDGRVDNIRILDAQPRNMFERDVRQAMKRWRYEPKAAKDLVVTLVFKMEGGGDVED